MALYIVGLNWFTASWVTIKSREQKGRIIEYVEVHSRQVENQDRDILFESSIEARGR